jgi:type VI secretion system secreted protein VgrG
MSVPGGFPAAALRLGPEGAALLKGVETLRLEPYDDQTGTAVDKWVKGATIGYGHLIRKGEWATYEDGITEAEAAALFDADVAPYEAAVGLSITIGLQQHEFDALVIFAFNIGKGGFVGSSVVKLINNPKAITPYAGVEAAWMAWSRSQGKVMRGLYNRRRCEWQIYKQARYERW